MPYESIKISDETKAKLDVYRKQEGIGYDLVLKRILERIPKTINKHINSRLSMAQERLMDKEDMVRPDGGFVHWVCPVCKTVFPENEEHKAIAFPSVSTCPKCGYYVDHLFEILNYNLPLGSDGLSGLTIINPGKAFTLKTVWLEEWVLQDIGTLCEWLDYECSIRVEGECMVLTFGKCGYHQRKCEGMTEEQKEQMYSPEAVEKMDELGKIICHTREKMQYR